MVNGVCLGILHALYLVPEGQRMRVIANNYMRHIIKGTDVHSQSAQKVSGFVLPFHFRRTKLPPVESRSPILRWITRQA